MGLLDIFKIDEIKEENEQLKRELAETQAKLQALGYTEYVQVKAEIDKKNRIIEQNEQTIAKQNQKNLELSQDGEKALKRLNTVQSKLSRSKELYESVNYAITNFFDFTPDLRYCKLSDLDEADYQQLCPSVILKLHHMDVKDLRKAYRDNEKQINKVLEQYESRYTTKANKTIYSLMVIALQAELQNVLYNLKYEKLDTAIEQVKSITAKYLKIASDGNQSIAGTITKFIGEIEYLFLNAVKIEYNYYVKKEQAKQEQLAIREKMRQEAEERKALETEKKKVEAEESKYQGQISSLKEQLASVEDSESEQLKKKILELEAQLAAVTLKKEDIVNLQNGKAGNVYIISNLGSFGENMFKIGMTRRLNPQDRVNELGDASVPFKFDVHSFIFSEDAVSLESALHQRLNDKRVNKVNMRKEFFYSDVDELENLVNEIDPTAEFNKTMIAEEFRQSLSTDENYACVSDEDDAEESEE